MHDAALAAFKVRLTLSLNDTNRHERPNTTLAEVVDHQLRRYATDTFNEYVAKEIRNFKQASLTQ